MPSLPKGFSPHPQLGLDVSISKERGEWKVGDYSACWDT